MPFDVIACARVDAAGVTGTFRNHSPGKRRLLSWPLLVYCWCMARTNVDIDDQACATVMRRYQLATKRDAINFALRTLAAEPLGLDEARSLRGSGWTGDLDEMRAHRTS